MKNIKRVCLVGLVVIIFGMLIIRVATLEEQRAYLQKSIDQMFKYNFTSLCSGIPVTEDMDMMAVKERDMVHASFCWSLFSTTSYAGNQKLNDIVMDLHNLCEQKTLRNVVDVGLAQRLNELAYRDFDEDLCQSVFDELRDKMAKADNESTPTNSAQ